MILIEGCWEEVNDLDDAVNIVSYYYNFELATEIRKLIPAHTDEEYNDLLYKIEKLENENESLQDENCSLNSENDKLYEKIAELENELLTN